MTGGYYSYFGAPSGPPPKYEGQCGINTFDKKPANANNKATSTAYHTSLEEKLEQNRGLLGEEAYRALSAKLHGLDTASSNPVGNEIESTISSRERKYHSLQSALSDTIDQIQRLRWQLPPRQSQMLYFRVSDLEHPIFDDTSSLTPNFDKLMQLKCEADELLSDLMHGVPPELVPFSPPLTGRAESFWYTENEKSAPISYQPETNPFQQAPHSPLEPRRSFEDLETLLLRLHEEDRIGSFDVDVFSERLLRIKKEQAVMMSKSGTLSWSQCDVLQQELKNLRVDILSREGLP